MSEYCKNCFELQNKIEELKAENGRLKALCDTYRTCYQAKHGDIKCLLIKYKQTLQEIKAIAENAYCLINYTNKDMANLAKQILLKITKAEEK